MTNYCKIGPVGLPDPYLFKGNNYSLNRNDKIPVKCTVAQAKQIIGLVGDGKVTPASGLLIANCNSPWGIVPIDASTYLTDNVHLTHRGLYQINDVDITERKQSRHVDLLLGVQRVGEYDGEILRMHYTPTTLSKRSQGYSDLTQLFTLNDPFNTFDTTNTWFPATATGMSSGAIAAAGGKLEFTGASSVSGVEGKRWTQTRILSNHPFTIEGTMEWVAKPASGQPSHSINFFFSKNRFSTTLSWTDTVVLAITVTSGNVFYHAYSINAAGGWMTLIPPTNITGNVLGFKIETDSKYYIRISVNTGGGYVQVYYGPTNLSTWNQLYMGLSLHNGSTTSAMVRSDYLQVYNYNESTYNTVITYPAGAIPRETATGTRSGSEGSIPYHVNPVGPKYYTITTDNYFKGMVQAYSTNNPTSTSNLVTSTWEVLKPGKFSIHNTLTRLNFNATSVDFQYYSGGWNTFQTFHLGTIGLIKPLTLGPFYSCIQVGFTKWHINHGKPFVTVEHPYNSIPYTIRTCYAHDGGITDSPGSGAPITIQTSMYATMWNKGSGTCASPNPVQDIRFMVMKNTPSNITSNGLPASALTGLGWFDNTKASNSPDHPSNLYKEWMVETLQKIGVDTI